MLLYIKELLQRNKSIIVYLVFGVLTTVVNFLVYFPLYNVAGLSATVSSMIAWCVEVSIAFLTNKPFVYHSTDWSPETVLPEALKFIGGRIGSGLAEVLILYITVELAFWNGNLMKLITSVLVVVLNYVFGKFIAFKK